GELPDGRPFLSMKLVEGATLDQLLRVRPDPSHDLPRFVQVFEQICQAVGYAHSKGGAHRDLKPDNGMVGEFGEVQVMDWGLAKVITAAEVVGKAEAGAGEGLTRVGAVIGTPAYMAPEQARGEVEQLDERCDVFGLGGILCEILTGQPPFLR